jgi:predicted AlkP superfamily pyrophosphatase or phosphodiesterase
MLPGAAGPAPEPGYSAAVASDGPVLPDYTGACVARLVPALLRRGEASEPWMAAPVAEARQVVLLVVDGLGWEQMLEHRAELPTVAAGEGGPVTSVVPTTTATALTSITTGRTPAEHGVLGYRLALPPEGEHGARPVLNVLHWSAGNADLRARLPAQSLQPHRPFAGSAVAVVTRSEFASTGFTAVHLGGTRLVGWRMPSTLVVEAHRLLRAGEPFVYAYYDGVDKVAHEHGLGQHYRAELRAVDRLVGDLVDGLPPGAALVVTSDHGQVQVDEPARLPGPEIMSSTALVSGEGRFRWLHARPGAAVDLAKAAEEAYGDEAWVRTREQIVDEGWFGGPLSPEAADRLGDVAVVARAPVAYLDPADPGETRLLARHGSLTSAEMLVPVLAWSAP